MTALNTDAETLLGENIDTATTILKYHLQELPIEDGTVVGACNNATVLAPAPVCAGTAHVIDAVLLPPELCSEE